MINQVLKIVYQEDKSLVIQFPELNGVQNNLVIAPLEKGVNWCLNVENEKPEPMTYLSEPPLSFEFISMRVECEAWYQDLSEELWCKLASYPGMEFTLLYHIVQYQAADNLFKVNANLLWLLLSEAKKQNWMEDTTVSLLTHNRKYLMDVIGLPSTKSAIKLLQKIECEQFDALIYERIFKLFQQPNKYSLLNHRDVLSGELVSLLARFPWMIESILIQHEFQCYDQVVLLLAKIEGYDKYLEEIEVGKKRLCTIKNEVQLSRLAKQLLKRCDQRAFIKQLPENNYPPIPFPLPDDGWLLAIKGSQELAVEADLVNNCSFSYDRAIRENKYLILKSINPIAMVGLEIHENNPPSIDQVELYKSKSTDDLEDIHNRMHRWLYLRHKEPYFTRQVSRVRGIKQQSSPFFRKVFQCAHLTLDYCTQEQIKVSFISSLGRNILWALRGEADEDDKGIFLPKEDVGILFLEVIDFSTPEVPEIDIKILKENFSTTDIESLDKVVDIFLKVIDQSFIDFEEVRMKDFISIWDTCLHGLWMDRILDNGRKV